MFKKFFSKVSVNDGEDDISSLEKTRVNTFTDQLSKEIVITIGTFLQLSELNNLARCDQFLLELFFSLTTGKVNAITQRKKELLKLDIETKIVSMKDQYEEESESFSIIQTLIWKPLVLYHFPNYSRTVNIKNWMHVMRRRVIHLQNKFPHELPLSKIIPESPTGTGGTKRKNKDRQFIENCEWEFKCPLKNNAFTAVSANVKFCDVCKENVYEVLNEREFKIHVEQGHCVAFSEYLVKNRPMLKGRVFITTPTLSPVNQNNIKTHFR